MNQSAKGHFASIGHASSAGKASTFQPPHRWICVFVLLYPFVLSILLFPSTCAPSFPLPSLFYLSAALPHSITLLCPRSFTPQLPSLFPPLLPLSLFYSLLLSISLLPLHCPRFFTSLLLSIALLLLHCSPSLLPLHCPHLFFTSPLPSSLFYLSIAFHRCFTCSLPSIPLLPLRCHHSSPSPLPSVGLIPLHAPIALSLSCPP